MEDELNKIVEEKLKKEKARKTLTTSDCLAELLPTLVFLPDEDVKLYKAFYKAFIENVKPKDFIEQIYIQDSAYYTWEVERYKKLKVSTINIAKREAAEEIFFICLFNKDRNKIEATIYARTLSYNLIGGSKEERSEAIKILEEHGFGEADIQASCYSLKIKEFESIDKCLSAANYRRNECLRELERHREYLAKRAREYSEQRISDAEFVEAAP